MKKLMRITLAAFPRGAGLGLGIVIAGLCAARQPEQPSSPPTPPTSPTSPVAVPSPATTTAPASPPAAAVTEVFPSVRIDRQKKLVEFDGEVPIDVSSKETPITYLEVMVCTRDTKEHEALVMSVARAAHVHAALLLVGLEPGAPGSWSFEPVARRMTDTPPKGPRLDVTVVTRNADGVERESRLSDWAVNQKDGRTLTSTIGAPEEGAWVFAGSREKMIEGKNVYKADADGTLIGLCTFGSETIAWSGVLSPESMVQAPEWIADTKSVPPAGTKVVIRVRAVEAAEKPATP